MENKKIHKWMSTKDPEFIGNNQVHTCFTGWYQVFAVEPWLPHEQVLQSLTN